MTDNAPSRKDWKDLYQKTAEFKKLKPWEWMYDREIFAVQNPETGEVAYCSVMGRMESFYGVAVYLGREGLGNYFDIQSGEISPDDPGSLYQQRALMVSFEDRDEIGDEDYKIIRKLGLRFRGKNEWPFFRSLRPHYYPWYLEADEAQFLTLVLEQAIDICKRLKKDPDLLIPSSYGKIFIRTPENTGEWKDDWIDPWYDEEEELISLGEEMGGSVGKDLGHNIRDEAGSIQEGAGSLPEEETAGSLHLKVIQKFIKEKNQGIWEVDYHFHPEAVQEEPNERPYFPATIIWADHETGEVIGAELAEPSQWKSFFPETFINAVAKTQHLPSIIQYENAELLPLLKFITQMGVELEEVYDLDVLGPVQEEFLNSEDNPIIEVLSILEDESVHKLLEMAMEDEKLEMLIQTGQLEDFLKNEKVQTFLLEEGVLRENPMGFEVPNVVKAERKLKERDNSQQTFFQKDSDSELLKAGKSIYQFRIDLDGIRPPIWRRILIPGTYTLRDLHQAIQDVMGWEDCHLHQFRVADPFSGQPITMENHDEETEIIEDWFTMETPMGSYTYDFGDNWEHIIKLEKITSLDADATYPQCIKGKRACPPEDCGGVWGYLEMLDILKDPEHEEYEETVEWLGEDFNPEKFDTKDVVFMGPDDK